MIELQLFPALAGEVTPIVIAFVLGILFGTQLQGKISKRMIGMIIGLSIIAAVLFEAPIFTWSLLAGFISEHISISVAFVAATIGMFVGKAFRGGRE